MTWYIHLHLRMGYLSSVSLSFFLSFILSLSVLSSPEKLIAKCASCHSVKKNHSHPYLIMPPRLLGRSLEAAVRSSWGPFSKKSQTTLWAAWENIVPKKNGHFISIMTRQFLWQDMFGDTTPNAQIVPWTDKPDTHVQYIHVRKLICI